jgi:hypothetical protein
MTKILERTEIPVESNHRRFIDKRPKRRMDTPTAPRTPRYAFCSPGIKAERFLRENDAKD